MAVANDLEIEIKIQLGSFLDYLKLLGYIGPIDREEHHINAFFDSAERKLSQAGYALRVRATDRSGSVTLKSRGSRSDAMSIREEIIGEIDPGLARSVIGGQTDLMGLDTEPITIIREKFPKLKPILLLQFRNDRQIKHYRLADYDLDLEIDKTEFADGSIEYELEVELEDEIQFERVQDSLRHMFNTLAIPLVSQTRSKFERALERG